jgi:phosphate transport system permease protein
MASEVKTKEDYLAPIKEKTTSGIITNDKFAKGFLLVIASLAIIIVFLIIIYLFSLAGDFFQQYPLREFLLGETWSPDSDIPSFGARNIIVGTLLVGIGALIIAIPLGIATAVFIAEVAPKKIKGVLKGAIEILSGIPSVIFGYFGRKVLREFLQVQFDLNSGLCWLNASFLLAIMALPTIVSVCEDAIDSVPQSFKNASFAMGATRWQTISKVILPAAMSGITAGVILGMGRALGETITVTMVAGNNIVIPEPITNIFSGVQTITATLALQIKNATGLHRQSLFALGIVLFIISLIINFVSNLILSRIRKKFTGKSKNRFLNKLKGVFNPKKPKKIHLTRKLKKGIKRIKNESGVSYVGTILRRRRGIVLRALFFVFSTWILRNWFFDYYPENAFYYAMLITSAILVVFFIYKKLKPKIQQAFAFIALLLATLVVLFFVGLIVYTIVENGLPTLLSNEFLTTSSHADRNPVESFILRELDLSAEVENFIKDRSPIDMGGILGEIIGTLELTIFSVLFAAPIGILAGIYLSEYAREGPITKGIRLAIDSLNGTPSIVFGLFGYATLVLTMKGRSLLAGVITLGLMILPVLIRTTEEGLKSIPQSFRRGSLALGSSKWQSISKIALPAALPAIMTGIILAMGRVAGETAPILFTAASFTQRFEPLAFFSPDGWTDTTQCLTFHLYKLIIGFPGADARAGGVALTLLLLVLSMYGVAFIMRRYYKKNKDW